MENRQDEWEKLVHIAEEYEPDPDLGNRTVRELKCSPVKQRKKWSVYRWLSIAACCLVVIGLSVFLPVYFSSRKEIVYYSSEDLEMIEVLDVEEFQRQEGLNFNYFSGSMVQSQAGKVILTGEIVYIEQNIVNIWSSSVDTVNLCAVIVNDAKFDFLNVYNDAVQTFILSETEIYYAIKNAQNSDLFSCLAKFTYENVDYYMTITTSNGSTETIENYVELLLGI